MTKKRLVLAAVASSVLCGVGTVFGELLVAAVTGDGFLAVKWLLKMLHVSTGTWLLVHWLWRDCE